VTTYAETLTALADPTRRRVFETLAVHPMSVAELAEGFSVSRPAISQHLKILKGASLVVDRPEGTHRVYRLNPGGLSELRGYLDRFWEQALASYKAVAESEKEEGT
jgi:DNA-binding transcriptional ArsR family regulator